VSRTAQGWLKVNAVEGIFRECRAGMHRTFETMVASEVNAAATGNPVEPLELLNALTTGLPSTPAEERY
jgi:hypothetical protein